MEQEFVDRVLKCADCNQEFVFTAGEQSFFSSKQFTNDPKRCKTCKAKRTERPERRGRAAREETCTIYSQCGVETVVPFKPTRGRPVLCRECFCKKNRLR